MIKKILKVVSILFGYLFVVCGISIYFVVKYCWKLIKVVSYEYKTNYFSRKC